MSGPPRGPFTAAFTRERPARDARPGSARIPPNTSITASAAAVAVEVAGPANPPGWNPQTSRFLVPDVGFYLTIYPMRRRTSLGLIPPLLLLLASGCGHPVQRQLEGTWHGDSVENFDERDLPRATGWAKSLRF